jgi:hypothetical protein
LVLLHKILSQHRHHHRKETEEAGNILDLNEKAGSSLDLSSVFNHGELADVLQRDARIHDRPTDRALKFSLLIIFGKKNWVKMDYLLVSKLC